MFHHQTGAAACDVRDDGRASMDFGHQSEIDRECQLHLLTLVQPETFGLHKDTICAEIHGPADPALASRQNHVDRRSGAMAGV